jgi:hypothetical protein
VNAQPPPRTTSRRSSTAGDRNLRTWLPIILIGLALAASAGYILYVVQADDDGQMKDLSFGFAALGLCFAAIALGCLFAMWRAASRARGGRSFGLAIVGGLAALAAIGSFSVTALLTLVLNS